MINRKFLCRPLHRRTRLAAALIGLLPFVAFSQFQVDRDRILATAGQATGGPHDFNVASPAPAEATEAFSYSWPVYFRFAFTPAGDAAAVRIEVLDEKLNTVWDVTLEGKAAEWTSKIPAKGSVRVTRLEGPGGQVRRDPAMGNPAANRPQSFTHEKPVFETMIHPPQAQRIVNLGKPVARLSWIGDNTLFYYCTGFLIADNLLVTNDHCMKTSTEIKRTSVEFDVDTSRDQAVTTLAKIKRLALPASEIDLAVYELQAPVSDRKISNWMIDRPAPSAQVRTPLTKEEALVLIQHPDGDAKKAAIVDCRITQTGMPPKQGGEHDFGHFCDSQGGSSGSPVLDYDSERVVGVHHWGFNTDAGKADPNNPERVNRAIPIYLLYQRMMDSNDPLLVQVATERAKP